MQNKILHKDNTIYFSKWSRKSYAIFSGLGKNIKISRLSVDVCLKSILKLNRFTVLSKDNIKLLILKAQTLSIEDVEKNILQAIQLLGIKINLDINSLSKGNLYLIYNKNIKRQFGYFRFAFYDIK